MNNPIPLQISCATDKELITLTHCGTYTHYYKTMIFTEIANRRKNNAIHSLCAKYRIS